jgi:hypothetical protein
LSQQRILLSPASYFDPISSLQQTRNNQAVAEVTRGRGETKPPRPPPFGSVDLMAVSDPQPTDGLSAKIDGITHLLATGAVDARYLFPETAFPNPQFGQFLSEFAS